MAPLPILTNASSAARAMAAREPQGTRVILDRPTGKAVLQVAAAHDRYPLVILKNPCGPALSIEARGVGKDIAMPVPISTINGVVRM